MYTHMLTAANMYIRTHTHTHAYMYIRAHTHTHAFTNSTQPQVQTCLFSATYPFKTRARARRLLRARSPLKVSPADSFIGACACVRVMCLCIYVNVCIRHVHMHIHTHMYVMYANKSPTENLVG